MQNKTKLLTGIIAGVMTLVFMMVFVFGMVSGGSAGTDVLETKPIAATISQDDNAEQVTDDLDVAQTRKDMLTLSFIGDCIIGSESGKINDGNFSYVAANGEHSYFFDKVKDELSKDDFTIANMECVLTDRELEKVGKDYDPAFWYKAPTSSTDILTLGSVEVASIVNNHTGDYGEEGYSDTVDALKKYGLQVGENLTPLYIEKNGIKIGLLCCNLWSSYNVSYIEESLETMQGKCDYRIVLFHGGTEAVHEPDNYKIDACRYLAQSGLCDLIVGSHPHVLQPMEIVNNVPILYSLGNFCYSANNYPENKSVIFRVELKREKDKIITETELIPCYVYTGYINNYQPAVMPEGEDKEEVLAFMSQKVEHQTETTAPTTTPPSTPAPTEAPGYEDSYEEASVPEEVPEYTEFEGIQVPY